MRPVRKVYLREIFESIDESRIESQATDFGIKVFLGRKLCVVMITHMGRDFTFDSIADIKLVLSVLEGAGIKIEYI